MWVLEESTGWQKWNQVGFKWEMISVVAKKVDFLVWKVGGVAELFLGGLWTK